MIAIHPITGIPDSSLVPSSGRQLSPSDWSEPDSVKLCASSGDGPPVGAILLLPDKRLGRAVVSYSLRWLHVAESHRRQGVASALLQAASARAAEAGARRVHVPLSPRNAECLALFEQLGPTTGAPFVVSLLSGGL